MADSAAKLDTVESPVYMPVMVRPDLPKWALTVPLLAQLCASAVHPRTRERLVALLLMSQGPPFRCASQLCSALDRDVHTLLKWVHDFNARGLRGIDYQHSGGKKPQRSALAPLLDQVLAQAVQHAAQPVSKKLASLC